MAASKGMPTFSENLDDRLDVFFVGSGCAVRADFHARVYDFACQRFGVGVGAGAGAGQADIYCADAQGFHQVQDFDFFADAGVVNGWILQAVAQGFIVQHYFPDSRDFCAGVGVPVVDELVLHLYVAVGSPRVAASARPLNRVLRSASFESDSGTFSGQAGRRHKIKGALNSELCSCAAVVKNLAYRAFCKIRSGKSPP